MSDFSISAMSMASKAVDNQMASIEGAGETREHGDVRFQRTAQELGTDHHRHRGLLRTQDYIGAGTDFSSTGTDVNVQQAVNTTLESGFGSITDVLA